MGWRQKPEQDVSMLQGMGFEPTYDDPTAEAYGQSQGNQEPYVHVGPDGQLGLFVGDRHIRALTPEEAAHGAGYQPAPIPEQTMPTAQDGFTVTQDLPSRGRISARVSVDFDAHGNPTLLPDARDLGVAMLASAGNLAQQGGMQVRYEGYDGDPYAAQQQAAQGHSGDYGTGQPAADPNLAPQPNFAEGYNFWSTPAEQDEQQAPPEHEEQQQPMSDREYKRLLKQQAKEQEKQEKIQNAAHKAAAREIAKRMTKNPVKVLRLGIGAVLFASSYNVVSGRMSTEPTEIAKTAMTTPWHMASDATWGIGKIIKIIK